MFPKFFFIFLSFYLFVDSHIVSKRDEPDPEHQSWNKTLQWLVYPNESINGIKTCALDYSKLRKDIDDNHNDFNVYLKTLEHWDDSHDIDQDEDDENISLFLNAYNAFAVKIIRDNPCKIRFGKYCWPVRSIRDLGEWGNEIFDLKKGNIGGKEYSLNDLLSLLRSYQDPRILIAIVKTAISSPDLPKIAFESYNLDFLLNQTVAYFLENEDKGLYLDTIANTLYVSDLFDTYEDDFIAYSGSIENFILSYCPDVFTVNWIIDNDPDIRYFDWKWNLNTLEQAGVHFSYT